jgi:hypothetical protein
MSAFHPLWTLGDALSSTPRMSIESLLLAINGSIAIGALIGLLVGLFINGPKLGCVVLLAVPIAMVLFISWWQGEHPENLRSTSGLDFVFGPIWPSLGAVGGYYLGLLLRSLFERRG